MYIYIYVCVYVYIYIRIHIHMYRGIKRERVAICRKGDKVWGFCSVFRGGVAKGSRRILRGPINTLI